MSAPGPGIHKLDAASYHADPCHQPSLSSSVAKLLVARSPLHAWTAHPRLNPEFVPVVDSKFDIGTAAHAFAIEGENRIAVVEAADWKTKAAQTERDAARLAGLVPLLPHQYAAVRTMAVRLWDQLEAVNVAPSLFTDGKPEATIVWDEDGVTCRARLDWLHDDHTAIDDYKTSESASPDVWTRRMFQMGFDVQAAFYLRGLKAVTSEDASFRFVVQETAPPHAVTVVSLAPSALELAASKVQFAIDLWRRCLRDNHWPGYPSEICHAEAPAWEQERWLERQWHEEEAA